MHYISPKVIVVQSVPIHSITSATTNQNKSITTVPYNGRVLKVDSRYVTINTIVPAAIHVKTYLKVLVVTLLFRRILTLSYNFFVSIDDLMSTGSSHFVLRDSSQTHDHTLNNTHYRYLQSVLFPV